MMPGVYISLDFDPGIAKYTQEGDSLVLSFANDSTVTVTGFFAVDEEALPHFILPDGSCAFARDVFANTDIVTAYDWIGKQDGEMEEYRDNAGVLIDGVERLGFLGTDHWDQGFDGGNYEATATGDAARGSFTPPAGTATTVSITGIDTDEGSATVRFEVALSNPPKGGSATVTINVSGTEYDVAIGADGKGHIDVPNPNTEDVYTDASSVGATYVGIEGGGYGKVAEGANTSAQVADTINTTTASLGVSSVENGRCEVSVTVSNPGPYDTVLTLSDGGTITIPAGKGQASQSYEYKPGMGYELLVGGAGDDYTQGGSGNDIIYGGTGDDILFGGGGADVFAWTENDLDSGADKVMDFSFAEGDKLNFSDLLSPGETLEDLFGMLTLGVDTDTNRLSLQVLKGEHQVDVSVNVQGDELQSFIDTYVEQHGDTAGLNDALLTMMIQNAHG